MSATTLLAIDTATEACSAALLIGDELRARHAVAPRGHAERILPMLDELLAEAGIGIGAVEAIAFGRGPGSFTGVRVACAVVQGIAYARELPVLPVSTLAALAQGVAGEAGVGGWVLAAIDARMGQVYAGGFRVGADGLVVGIDQERVCNPAEVAAPGAGCWGVGTGFGAYGQALAAALGGALDQTRPEALPHAAAIARLGRRRYAEGGAVEAALALPVYLRDQVVHTQAAG